MMNSKDMMAIFLAGANASVIRKRDYMAFGHFMDLYLSEPSSAVAYFEKAVDCGTAHIAEILEMAENIRFDEISEDAKEFIRTRVGCVILNAFRIWIGSPDDENDENFEIDFPLLEKYFN